MKHLGIWKTCVVIGLIAMMEALSPGARGQTARREATPNDNLKSPEVLPDNRVVFRLYAPKAGEVSVGGDWVSQGLGKGGNLTKDDKGVWSITEGPLTPDFYSYTFTVDGVRTLDPKNAMVKQGVTSLDNMFLVPGEAAAFEDLRPVPHGDIQAVWYASSTLGTQRCLHVYTPPGYEKGRARLPVLYLLHGGGDEDSGWSTIGRAGFILDNLLATKTAKPMIIVMPNGSLPRPANLPAFTPGATPTPEAAAAREALQARFTKELMNDIMPFVEKRYRVRAKRESRALAGLSMGGGQALRIFAGNADQFGYVAIWSAGVGTNSVDFEQRNAAFLASADQINRQVKSLSIRAGDQDFALAGSKNLVEILNRHGIKNDFQTSAGGHTWINWRHYLRDLAPVLFQ